MRRVLVPTDFSEAALLVTREALSWVDAIDGELLLLHVVPDIFLRWLDQPAISFVDQARLESAYAELRAEGQRQFSTWLPPQAYERCRTYVVVGKVADAIIEVAQVEAADVIIMRAPKRRWWRPVLTGSVTDTVRRRAPMPVVIWSGLEQKPSNGCWQGVRQPREQDASGESARRNRTQERWASTPILKSWSARSGRLST
jgi:nucleotide-binding universal stress UspA family protein